MLEGTKGIGDFFVISVHRDVVFRRTSMNAGGVLGSSWYLSSSLRPGDNPPRRVHMLVSLVILRPLKSCVKAPKQHEKSW